MESKNTDREYYMFALRVIGDFGANIAIPVVVLALVGKFIDTKYGWTPWATIAGFTLAALISGLIIYRKAKRYGQEYQRMNEKTKK
jgi:F0F1-type ATP synthase assembly protein I